MNQPDTSWQRLTVCLWWVKDSIIYSFFFFFFFFLRLKCLLFLFNHSEDKKTTKKQQQKTVIWFYKFVFLSFIFIFSCFKTAFLQAFEDQKAEAKSLLGLATLACEENNCAQALILLDRVLAVGGDEEFWYKFTLTKVKTVVAGRNSDAYAEV